ncbi:MAG: hypothetical protein ACE5O2_00415 [Armatimonadota bacterium]
MRRIPAIIKILVVVLLVGVTALLYGKYRKRGTTGAVDWEGLITQRPWLDDVSTWSQTLNLAQGKPSTADLGCFPLGNGRVFTTLGMKLPLNTLENTIGPCYQKQAGFLGTETITVRVNGKDEPLNAQRVRRVRRSGIVRTACGGQRCVLYTIDFVPPDVDAIVRIIGVKNISERPIRAEAVVSFGGLPLDRPGRRPILCRGRIRVLAGVVGGEARWRKGDWYPGADGLRDESQVTAAGGRLSIPFGTIQPADSRAKVHYLAIGADEEEARESAAEVEKRRIALLDATHEWWRHWNEGTVSVSCGEHRVGDVIDAQKHIIRTQQAEVGGYSPMYRYTFCWARDSNGPVRYMLRAGKFEEVRRYLDFYYRACATRKAISMNHPLDLALAEPTPRVNWRDVQVERAEAPSLLVLQHYWYWRYSADVGPIKRHWAYLERCLEGQQVSADGRLPFHGDETYRFPGYEVFHLTQKTPRDYVFLDLYSADSAYEYVAAAAGLAEMARAMGDTQSARKWEKEAARLRAATERWYWMPDDRRYAAAMSTFSGERYPYPFACIDMSPLWVGYAAADDPKARTSALRSISYLWREDGTLDTTPGFGYGVGMTPGMLLWNLAAIDHPDADKALDGVLAAFSPSGGVAEMLTPENKPAERYWGKTRVRPWEGGINAEAILYYLSGFEPHAATMTARLCPRLPKGITRLNIENMRIRDNRLSVRMEDEVERVVYELGNEGPQAVRVELTVSLPPCEITTVVSRYLSLRESGAASPGRTALGRTRCLLAGELPSGRRAKVVVGYRPRRDARVPHVSRRPFVYPLPNVGDAKAVLITWDAEMADKWRSRERSLFVMDTRIAFPDEYLQAALLEAGGAKRRVDHVILDVNTFPGAFKTRGYWTIGAGGRILQKFERLGGRVTREQGRLKPRDLFGA